MDSLYAGYDLLISFQAYFHHCFLSKYLCKKEKMLVIKVNCIKLGVTKKLQVIFIMESSIKYVRKIFRKTNISYPLILTRTCAYQEVRKVIFRKILRTYVLTRWPPQQFLNLSLLHTDRLNYFSLWATGYLMI